MSPPCPGVARAATPLPRAGKGWPALHYGGGGLAPQTQKRKEEKSLKKRRKNSKNLSKNATSLISDQNWLDGLN